MVEREAGRNLDYAPQRVKGRKRTIGPPRAGLEFEGRCAQERNIVGKRLAWPFAYFPYRRVTRRATAQAGHMRQEILDGDFASGRDRVELDCRRPLLRDCYFCVFEVRDNCETGSLRRSLPSSISISMAAPVMGFDIDQMRKMESFAMGFFESRSMDPCASRWAMRPLRMTSVTAPGVVGIDVSLDCVVDSLEPFTG
jgi:hypothetical protein